MVNQYYRLLSMLLYLPTGLLGPRIPPLNQPTRAPESAYASTTNDGSGAEQVRPKSEAKAVRNRILLKFMKYLVFVLSLLDRHRYDNAENKK